MRAIKLIIIYVYSGLTLFSALAQSNRFENLPPGLFRSQVEALPSNIQTQVFEKVSALEIPDLDFESLRVHPRGSLFYVCDLEVPLQTEPAVFATVVFSNGVSIASPPIFHSRPGATNVLFIDFNGAVITNTYWNTYPGYEAPIWDCRPYSIDTNETMFSVAEQQAIQTIWERVAEDYAPFDIDVTTEQPPEWTRYTGHVLITPETDKNGVKCPHFGAGGVAFVDVFGDVEYSYDYTNGCLSPAWVLNYEIPGAAEFEAEAASHEMGHNLALSHDGTKSEPYYGGHENGSISWGPIMGTGYNRNVSQWSKGDYRMSNNTQDDLAIIDARLGYRPDDFGSNQLFAATLNSVVPGTVSQTGVIEHSTDVDVFEFTTASGMVEIVITPYRDASSTTWGGNLDIILELRDAGGNLIATDNPELETTAAISAQLTNGTYYLHIKATGVGNPLQPPSPNGYVQYGSLGQYFLSGSVPIDPDSDEDGLPDDWETAYFGNATNGWGFLDNDGDGQDNISEYIAGTIPTNPASVFSVTTFEVPAAGTNASFIVTWDSIAGRIYNVDWSDNLMLNAFTNISGSLSYPANSYTDSVERAEQGQFYRVDVRLAE